MGRRLTNSSYKPRYPHKKRSECKKPDSWKTPSDYPVLSTNIPAYSAAELRYHWFKWIHYSDRKKSEIRKITRYWVKMFFNMLGNKYETTKIIKKKHI